MSYLRDISDSDLETRVVEKYKALQKSICIAGALSITGQLDDAAAGDNGPGEPEASNPVVKL